MGQPVSWDTWDRLQTRGWAGNSSTDQTAATTMMTLAGATSYFRRDVSGPMGPDQGDLCSWGPPVPLLSQGLRSKTGQGEVALASPPELHWDLPELSFETKNCTV